MKTLPGLPNLTVGSIFCIGRNYAKHAHELGNAVPDEPMVFLKPASSLIGDGGAIYLPSSSNDVHHEVEMVIAIGKQGKNIPKDNALEYIAGYAIGIDVTARDIQQKAKDRGHPWSVAKGFDTFAPLSKFKRASSTTRWENINLELRVNNEQRQKGNTKHMIFPVGELIAHLSTIFTLRPGDMIFTGTPEGVSRIDEGDKIEAILGDQEIVLNVTAKRDAQ